MTGRSGAGATAVNDSMRHASDEELAAAVHAGDQAAFTMLHDRWARRLYGFLAARMPAGTLADAETLAADTLTEAWLSLQSTVPEHFSGWIHTIARRVLATHLKSRGLCSDKADTQADACLAAAARAGASPDGPKKRTRPVLVPIDTMTEADDPAAWLTFREAEQKADWPTFAGLLLDSIDSLPQPYRTLLRASLEEFLASQPPADGESVKGQDLARRFGITSQQANRQRSDGLDQLNRVFTVMALARSYGGTEPCPRFRRWAGSGRKEGPLGERLRARLVRHLSQCPQCSSAGKRLRTTMELFPVFIPAPLPVRLLTPEHPVAPPGQAQDTGDQAAHPSHPRPGRSAAHSAARNLFNSASHTVWGLVTASPVHILSAVLVVSVGLLSAADAPGRVTTKHPHSPGTQSALSEPTAAPSSPPPARVRPPTTPPGRPPRPTANAVSPSMIRTTPSTQQTPAPPTPSVMRTTPSTAQTTPSGCRPPRPPLRRHPPDADHPQLTDSCARPARTTD